MKKALDIELDFENIKNFKNYFLNENSNKPIRFLPKTNHINILIGSNNSGKSRFLRSLMNQNKLLGVHNINSLKLFIEEYNVLINSFDSVFSVSSSLISYLTQTYGKEKINDELKLVANNTFKLIPIDFNFHLYKLFQGMKQNLLLIDQIDMVLFGADELSVSGRRNYLRGLNVNNNRFISNNYINESALTNLKDKLNPIRNVSNQIKQYVNGLEIKRGGRIYIPTLRTAHSLFEPDISSIENESSERVSRNRINKDIFQETIRKNYESLSKDIDIFTGLNLYNEIVNTRNSKKENRSKFHEFEEFLRLHFFDGKEIDIVADFNIEKNHSGDYQDNLIQIFIGNKSEKLHDLGDGIQSLIILMYKIFLAEKDSIIYIDEPELNLHPGYQRLFLEQITTNKNLLDKNLTYFIVTHSNHFLDLTLEKDNISIYSFNSLDKEKFLIRNVNAGDNQTLRNLGVNNSSVFLANSSIWVEGISDRNFIKAFLLAYCESKKKPRPREDIDFAFFEYAGSNLVHYDFDKRNKNAYKEEKDLITSYALNNKILLISDLDSGKDTKHSHIDEIAKSTEGFEYKTTKPYREIENLLSDSIWSKVLIEFCNKNDVKKNKANIQKRIEESLEKTKPEKFKNNYIGVFLKELKITELNSIYKVNDDKSPGTFIPKAELSQIVLSKVRSKEITWGDFSSNKTIVELTKSVYDFIEKAKN
ncbi:AAA family ATPase [uncultured Psychroserpens sp.]|uniref:AAA family ATPase n=1 Tax=uncultured Psychroserpens sp. TaxID=255436 RepID=UPI00262A14BC|nr:AAA family ATPase [uncultured Psychroserpens sp.]